MQQLLVKKAHVNEDLLPLGGAGILERGVYASSSSRVNYPQLSPGLFTGQPQTSQLQTIFCSLPTHLQTLTGTLCWRWRYNSWCNCLWQDTEASWPWTTCQPALGGLCQHSRGLRAISVHCWQAGYLAHLVARTALARETLWFGLYIVSVSANMASPFVRNHWEGGRKRLADIYCISSLPPGYWEPLVLNNQAATFVGATEVLMFWAYSCSHSIILLFRPPCLWTFLLLYVPYQTCITSQGSM